MPVSGVVTVGQPFTKRITGAAPIRLPANGIYNWTDSWLKLAFDPGGRIDVASQNFRTSGMTFTESELSEGWGGVSVTGGNVTLGAEAIVERVQGTASHPAALLVTGGSAVLDGAFVRYTAGGAGMLASGSGSTVRITGATSIHDNASGPGVEARAGAQVTVNSDLAQIFRNAEGVVATGARVLVLAGSIRDNEGPGVRAASGGRVDVLRDDGLGTTSLTVTTSPVRVVSNVGGLYATSTGKQGGAVVSTGDAVCVQPPCASIGGHRLDFNTQPPPGGGPVYDALALGGSQVLATSNYWNGRTSAQVEATTLADKSSLVNVGGALVLPPSAGGGTSRRSATGVPEPPTVSGAMFGRGRVGAAVQMRLAEADGFLQDGDSTLAGVRVTEAAMLVASDDDRLAVAEAAGRALSAFWPTGLVAWAESAVVSAVDRPWGRRALAAGLAGQGRFAEAAALARALADEDGAASDSLSEAHRARGLGLLVEVAVASGDGPAAVAALNRLAEVDPEGAAELAVTVAVAFPDAVVTLARRVAGRAPQPGHSAQPNTAETAGKTGEVTLAAGPSPSAGAVRVSLSLGGAADARVEVFDAIGRRVAVLHEGAASGVVEATFDGVSFPAGVYVVRAVVRLADGSVSVVARRVVVAR